MTHGSLFSGIGGFELAAEWCGFENVFPVNRIHSANAYSNTTGPTQTTTTMSKHFPHQITLDELISSQEDSHVSHTASQESDWARMTTATSGRSCLTSFEKLRQPTSWAKMFAALLIGQEGWSSKRCVLTWKLKGTTFNRSYFLLRASALPTDGIASGLLLTPTTSEQVQDLDKFKARMEKYPNGTTMPNLATQVVGLLPTPVVQASQRKLNEDGRNVSAAGQSYGVSLQQLAKSGMLPTPTAQEFRDSQLTPAQAKKLDKGGRVLRRLGTLGTLEDGKSSQLNPRFVAEMMGFPPNWTESPFQSGELSQSKPTETP